jgi:hypothetical protein
MRPIETHEAKEKRKHRDSVILGIIIVGILILSTVGFAVLESSQENNKNTQTTYNNYDFVKTDYGWQTTVQILGQSIVLNTKYLPSEVENISMEGDPILDDFYNKAIFLVASEQNEIQAISEYGIFEGLAERMQFACSLENSNSSTCLEKNWPIKSCDDANQQNTIIIVKETKDINDNSTTINYKNSCIQIQGKGAELIKANEKAIFKILGIIN